MTPRNRTSLKQRALGAGGWSMAGYGINQAIRLAGNLVMTRLLVPEMFGVMAIATTVIVILGLMADIGVQQNVVQSRRGDDPVFLDTAWTVQIVRGFVLWILAILLSIGLYLAGGAGMLPDKSVYASPVLPSVLAVSSFTAVIAGFQSTKVAAAYRSFDGKRLFQINLIAQLAGLIVMIVIGVIGRSIWALVAAGLVGALTTTVLSHVWLSGHANHFRWEKNALQEMVGFGKWVFVSSVASVLAMNGDRLLLGGFVEADLMGLYAIAAMIISAIVGALIRLGGSVSLPALSEIARNDPSRLREVYYKLRVPTDLLLLFLSGLLFAAGQLLIDLLYDSRYSGAGGMLRILALSLFAARYEVARAMYVAMGIPRYWTVISLVRFVSLYALVPTLYYLAGAQAAIWGIALHGLAAVPFFYAFGSRFRLNDFRREFVVLLALPVGYLGGMGLNLLRG